MILLSKFRVWNNHATTFFCFALFFVAPLYYLTNNCNSNSRCWCNLVFMMEPIVQTPIMDMLIITVHLSPSAFGYGYNGGRSIWILICRNSLRSNNHGASLNLYGRGPYGIGDACFFTAITEMMHRTCNGSLHHWRWICCHMEYQPSSTTTNEVLLPSEHWFNQDTWTLMWQPLYRYVYNPSSSFGKWWLKLVNESLPEVLHFAHATKRMLIKVATPLHYLFLCATQEILSPTQDAALAFHDVSIVQNTNYGNADFYPVLTARGYVRRNAGQGLMNFDFSDIPPKRHCYIGFTWFIWRGPYVWWCIFSR